MYQINFYVPQDYAEATMDAMFAAGAGRIGNYDCCAWQSMGKGQFRPLDGSNAFIGSIGNLEFVDEIRVEMVCEDTCVEAVIDALRAAHPYETPAYFVVRSGFPPSK